MSAIEDLERKVQSLASQLSAAQQSLRRARIEAAPVKVGDVVIDRRYGACIVRDVSPTYTGFRIVGSPRKSNGEFGMARRNLSNWTKP